MALIKTSKQRCRGQAVASLLVLVGGLGYVQEVKSQTWVGRNVEGGLSWHVSAPQNASWRLLCRHPPVIYYRSQYDQRAWRNMLQRSGSGDASGRLPLFTGYCYLWKTGGSGPVAIGLARPGEAVADATLVLGEPAEVGLLPSQPTPP